MVGITRRGGDYTVAVDGEILLKHHDDNPLRGSHKFCVVG
jgi:serine protease Do